jgi:DNA-binding IclR family transcriptional regulator
MPTVKSVARAARMLRLLCQASDGVTLTDVSADLGLHKTTALRLLRTLVSERMARRDSETGRYHLDTGLWLGATWAAEEALSFRASVQALLRELAEGTGATVFVMIPDGMRRRMVPTVWSLPDRPVRMDPSATTSQMQSMHANGGGKCYLASLPEAELREWLNSDLPRLTPRTITSPEKLLAELEQVRKQGYALNQQEAELGSSGVAVPVQDQSGVVIASLSFAVMPEDLTEAHLRKWVPQMRQAAEQLSQLFGGGRRPERKKG